MAPDSQQNVTAHRNTRKLVTRTRTAVTLATATVGTLTLVPGLAQADPGQSVSDVKTRVDALQQQAEQATEAYDKANDQLATLQHKVDQIQAKITLEQGAMDSAQSSLGTMAAAQYKAGGVDQTLQLMLASAPDMYLQQASAMAQAGSRQAGALQSAKDDARQLQQDKATAKDDLAALQKTRDSAAAAKKDIDAKEKQAQDLLNTLTQQQKDQYQQLQAKDTVPAPPPVTASTPSTPTSDVPVSARAALAVAYAEAQVGKPYVRAGVGPYGFDCSGLTMMAWAQAGVKLSHGSADQAHEGKVVSLKDIQPGDLVVYYNTRHHVGIYVGNGTIVHAPSPGSKVQYVKVTLMPISIIVRPG